MVAGRLVKQQMFPIPRGRCGFYKHASSVVASFCAHVRIEVGFCGLYVCDQFHKRTVHIQERIQEPEGEDATRPIAAALVVARHALRPNRGLCPPCPNLEARRGVLQTEICTSALRKRREFYMATRDPLGDAVVSGGSASIATSLQTLSGGPAHRGAAPRRCLFRPALAPRTNKHVQGGVHSVYVTDSLL